MRSAPIVVYGAYGYTGSLIVEALLRRGIRPIIAGRYALARFGASATLERRIGELHELAGMLGDVEVLLLAIGPFGERVGGVVEACLKTGTHYLDISGEIASIERVRSFDRRARARGLMLLPAIGFDVVASDCLLAHVARRIAGGAHALSLGVSGLGLMSRGSARTLVEQLGRPALIRRGGRLRGVPPGSLRRGFDFGAGPRECLVTTWGDIATAYFTTGAPNTTVYFEASPPLRVHAAASRVLSPWLRGPLAQMWMRAHAELLPRGPSHDARARRVACLMAYATGPKGQQARARLRTPEVYTFTAASAALIAARVLRGELDPGFQTPARVYGPELALAVPGVQREDLPA